MRQKPIRLYSRAAMMLLTVLMVFAGAQTARADFYVTPHITYGDGLSSSNVTIKATTLKISYDELETQTLTDGNQATFTVNPNDIGLIHVVVTSSEAITVKYSINNWAPNTGTEFYLSAHDGQSYTFYFTVSLVNAYKVHFDKNASDATGTIADQTFTVGQSQTLTANGFHRTGYAFSGWNTKADGSGTAYSDGQTVKDIAAAGQTITLYAQWGLTNKYTVHFDKNNGDALGSMADQVFTVGVEQALRANTFTPLIVLYSFSGWNTQANGSGVSYSDKQVVKDIAAAGQTITLYAQWTYHTNGPTPVGSSHIVHFDANGGEGTMANQTFSVGQSQTLTANTFTRDGYSFTGWNTKADGTGTSYSDQQKISLTDNITLYAQWKTTANIVHFDANGGEGTMADQTFTYGEAQTLTANTFHRDGYSFTGWNTKADGTGTSYSDKQNINPDGSMTLYAEWKLKDELYVNGDTYTINTATGWVKFRKLLDNNDKGYFTGKTVKLGNDIEVSHMAGSEGHEFTGTFDGNQKTLTFNHTTKAENAAPFQYVENATIKNLHVAGTITTSNKYAAGFIAQQYGNVTIQNCRSSVIIKSSKGGDGTHGGFVAVNNNSASLTIEGCVFDGKLLTTGATATSDCGGFVGWKNKNGTVTVTNSLYTPASLESGETECTTGSYTFVRNGSAGSNCYYTRTLGDAQGIWDGDPNFVKRGDGDGTSGNPYKITNADDLKDLAVYVNGTGTYSNGFTVDVAHDCSEVYFQQTNPITLTSAWTPIGTSTAPFKGHYNGGEYAISGLTVTGNYQYAGLFGKISSDIYHGSFISNELQNIHIVDCNINVGSVTDSKAGGIAGETGPVHLSGCRVSGSITGYSYAGGLVGIANQTYGVSVSNCFVDVTVTGTSNQYNDHLTPHVNLMTTVQGGGPSASDNYYHDRGGNVSVSDNSQIRNSATPLYTISGVPSGVTVAETNASVTFIDTPYFASGATATLTVDDANKLFKTFSVSGATYHLDSDKSATVTFDSSDVTVTATVTDPAHFADNGDGSYTIRTATGWGVFCDLLKENDKGYFTGKTVKLDANISVTTMAGTSSKPFTGIFDGQKYKLTVSYQNTDDNARTAPFSYVDGATIRNLVVDGSITGSNYRAAGFIGETGTTKSRITNCMSSLSISSGRYTGGFSIGGNVAIEGCVFCGTINGSARSGGFVGYSHSALTITNSLFAPKSGSSISGGTFYYDGGGDDTPNNRPSNCYYAVAPSSGSWGATAQGKKAYTLTTAPANLGAAVTGVSYTVLTAYANGIRFDGKYYVAPASISLADAATNSTTISNANGYVADVTLTGRTLYKDGKWNTLCLPFDVTIADSPLAGDGVDVRTLNSSDFDDGTLTLNFTAAPSETGAVTTLQAGRPYIIKWNNTGQHLTENELVFEGVTVSSTPANVSTGYVDFIGTYSPEGIYEDGDEKHNLYLGADNKLYYPTAENFKVNACRGWFQLKNGLTAGAPSSSGEQQVRAFNLSFGDEQTGIIATDYTDYTDKAGAWYTLDGVRLSGKPTKKGLYIHNGKKVLVRDKR